MPIYSIFYKTEKRKVRKNVKIAGKLKSWKHGRFPTRFGKMVDGIKFTYINRIKGGAGKSNKIKTMRLEKIVQLPKGCSIVKVRKRG